MDAHAPTLSSPHPNAEDQAWQQAAERVDALLRAYRVKSLEHRTNILINVLCKAREIHQPGTTHPVELSIGILSGALKHQLCSALNEKDFSRARLELWVADAISEIPELLATGVRRATMKPPQKIAAGPELELTAMLPRPIKLGTFTGLADQTFRSLGKRPLMRSLLVYASALGLMFALFWLTR